MRVTPYMQEQPHTITSVDPDDGLEHTCDRASFLADWQRAYGISIFITRP